MEGEQREAGPSHNPRRAVEKMPRAPSVPSGCPIFDLVLPHKHSPFFEMLESPPIL